MTKFLLNSSALVIISMSVCGTAMADQGDYYYGLDRDATASVNTEMANVGASVDHVTTASISDNKDLGGFARNGGGRDDNWPHFVDQGDYYQGVSRPN
ncbi:Hypothetical protein NGAL_HAMBI2605_66770 [Neorhizobium galegae bv. orientalis]|nr:Hypothetical protein NGAL_HAMBI2605_66770 [Neorhizobium galegae bv. orientalis]